MARAGSAAGRERLSAIRLGPRSIGERSTGAVAVAGAGAADWLAVLGTAGAGFAVRAGAVDVETGAGAIVGDGAVQRPAMKAQ